MKQIITTIFLMFCGLLAGQNRIPSNNENIIFYPLNENNSITKEGYDCFYSFNQVIAKGGYSFKSKYRFKNNGSNMTSANEIDAYTFYVENQEMVLDKGKECLLLFLRRNEDGEKVILRVPKYYDKKSNAITQSFTKLKYDYDSYYNKKYHYDIVLPYINADTLCSLKKQYAKKEIVYGLKGYNTLSNDSWNKREKDFKELSRVINEDFEKYNYNEPYNCIDFGFINLSNSLFYKQLCITMQAPHGEKITMPVVYLVGNTDFYDKRQDGVFYFLNNFFYEKAEYLQREFKRNKCEDIVQKYTGKKIYYGLDKMYKYETGRSKKFNALENRTISTNELYTIEKGTYECVRFDVFKRFDKDYSIMEEPFAVLKDSLGVEFRVPVCELSFTRYSYPEIRTSKFEEYFVLAEKVDSIVRERAEIKLQKELAEQKKMNSLTQKYGKSYADFLMDRGDITIERFEILSRKYGKANAKLMIGMRVRLGWSKEMCRESWGKPDKINTTTGAWGVHEQWVYEYSFDDSYSISCLYFENGVLTTIQD